MTSRKRLESVVRGHRRGTQQEELEDLVKRVRGQWMWQGSEHTEERKWRWREKADR